MNRKLLLIGIVIILVTVAAFGVRQATTFHLTGTNPKNGSQPNQYTAVSFMFNRPISTSAQTANQINLTPTVSGKTSVAGKAIIFIPDSSYQVGTEYSATLTGVTSTHGDRLGSIRINFQPKYVPYAQLPDDVKKRLIEQTDIGDTKPKPYSAEVIAIAGSTELLNHGLSSQQLTNLKLAYFQYFQSIQQEIRGMKLSNINKVPHDRYSASTTDTINFTTTLDSKATYSTKLEYFNLTGIRLYLYDTKSGSLIYDSKTLNN